MTTANDPKIAALIEKASALIDKIMAVEPAERDPQWTEDLHATCAAVPRRLRKHIMSSREREAGLFS